MKEKEHTQLDCYCLGKFKPAATSVVLVHFSIYKLVYFIDLKIIIGSKCGPKQNSVMRIHFSQFMEGVRQPS